MKTDFVPFWSSETDGNIQHPFLSVSDTYPSEKFETWTKENFEEMKQKNKQIEVDKFKPIW